MARKTPHRRRGVGARALIVFPALIACGSGVQGGADGPPPTGPQSFDVVAALTGDGSATVPPENRFTLILDAGPGLAVAGGNGRGAVVGVTTDDGRRFVSSSRFSVQIDAADACGAEEGVRYEMFDATISHAGLTGSAWGYALVSCGDACTVQVPFTATLTGTRDQTPPTLHPSGPPPATPFDPIVLLASEPLPMTATARLVADDGAAIDLVPTGVAGDVPVIVGFTKPDVLLRAGQGYVVALDGLVDFAGLVAPGGGTPLHVASFSAAPVVPEDGFESASGDVLGGAMVVRSGGALPVINGDTSLYIGGMGAPFLDAPNGRGLMLKLARSGRTTLHFSCSVVAWQAQSAFAGSIRIGSEGASASLMLAPFGTALATQTATIAGQTVYLSAAVQEDLALPADSTDAVVINIAPTDVSCAPGTPPGAGLMIDDIRLE